MKKSYVLDSLSLTGVVTVIFLFLEVLKAYRASQWSGTGPADGMGLLLGGLIYAGSLFGLAMLLQVAIRLITLGRLRAGRGLPLCFLVSAVLIWIFLSQYREYSPTLDDAVVLGGLGVFFAGLYFFLILKRFSILEYSALWGVILVGGLVSLGAAGQVFLFSINRTMLVTVLPALYMGLVGLLGVTLWLLTQERAQALRAVYGVVMPALPLVSAWLWLWTPAPSPEERRPNMVFIVADSLRADCMSAYGGAVATPQLEALGAQGALFESSYALAPWTMPSMAALFGSEYPQSLNPDSSGEDWLTQIWRYVVNPETRPLAKRLEEKGYATGAMTSNALLWGLPGMMEGFSVQARSHPILLMQEGLLNHLPFLQALVGAWLPDLDGVRAHDTTKDMTRYAKAFLRRHRDRPFYLWIHYIDPHAPYDPPERFRDQEGPWPMFYPYAGGERWGIPRLSLDFTVPEEHQAFTQALYEGEVRYVDEQVGEVIATLNALGLRDSTYVCFTSDHGEEFWDHGGWGHGQSVYNELLRVPLIVAGPEIPPARVSTPVSALHLMPTLAGLLDCDGDPHWLGQDLSVALRQGQRHYPQMPVYAQGTSNKAYPYPQQMVLEAGYKLIRQAGSSLRSLYNLAADPGEQQNLAERMPEKAQDLEALLDSWLASFNAFFDAELASEDAGAQEERFEQLRGMGYL